MAEAYLHTAQATTWDSAEWGGLLQLAVQTSGEESSLGVPAYDHGIQSAGTAFPVQAHLERHVLSEGSAEMFLSVHSSFK